ncbi:MAG: formylglycine-generating enzyme family protein [Planctomycetota bacterium]|jgi:formylglycine-generating enzyme required for sulfatase activity|nr:formylglycine-generating enzyme family protein [Planctomycetota bacterium]
MLRTPTLPSLLLVCTLALGVLGCGSDGGSSSGNLEDALSLEDATWIIVDLDAGRVYGRDTPGDLSDDSLRSSKIAFKRINGGSLTINADASGPDGFTSTSLQPYELSGTVTVGPYYLAVFELTQAQWQRLASSSPWSILGSDVSNVSADAAAHNLSLASVQSVLANAALSNVSLRLPSKQEWEYAARLSNNKHYAFGDNAGTTPPQADLIRPHAWTFETAAGDTGPFRVGAKQANGAGCFDMHGNVWEWTADGKIRGGSWRDVVQQARSSNVNDLDADIPHPLVGVRPALSLR